MGKIMLIYGTVGVLSVITAITRHERELLISGYSFGNQKILVEVENSEGRSLLVSDGGDDVGGRAIIPNEESRVGLGGSGRDLAFGGLDGGEGTRQSGDIGGNRGGSFNIKITS